MYVDTTNSKITVYVTGFKHLQEATLNTAQYGSDDQLLSVSKPRPLPFLFTTRGRPPRIRSHSQTSKLCIIPGSV